MSDLREELYKFLIKRENFYMKQYYSNYHKEEKYIAIKELKDGIYCVLISEIEEVDMDNLEVFEYIKSLGKAFSLNVIILTNGEYTYTNNSFLGNKFIINKENNGVIQCDDSCIPLKQIFEGVLQINKNKSTYYEKEYWKYKNLTFIIMGINIVTFLLTALLSGSIFNIDYWVLLKYGGKVNELINQGQYWRLLTCAFLHGGLIHIVGNMYSLYILGPEIQQIYGVYKYFIIYIFSCLTSSLLSYFMSPYLSVGASGGIFGLMGALVVFAIIERKRINKRYLSSLLQAMALNLFIGFSISNIDNFAHIGGLIGGILTGYISYKLVNKNT